MKTPARLALLLAMLGAATAAPACTNLLVTKGFLKMAARC